MGYILSFLGGCGFMYFASDTVQQNMANIAEEVERIAQNETRIKQEFVKLFQEAQMQGRLPELIQELQNESQRLAMMNK